MACHKRKWIEIEKIYTLFFAILPENSKGQWLFAFIIVVVIVVIPEPAVLAL